MAHRSQSFAYGTKTNNTNPITKRQPTIYSALLSRIAIELKQRVTLADHTKDDIEYKNTFDGKQVVVCEYVKLQVFFLIL
jgi:hypothetical protein